MEIELYHHITQEETYKDGEIIFEEGSSGDWVYVILSGAVEVSKTVGGRKFTLGVLEEGEILGELALIGDVKRTATARAVGETTVGIIDRTFLDNEFNKLSADFRPILVAIVQRFVSMMDRTREFSSRKQERLTKALSVKFKDGQAFVNAYTGNISSGGLFIRTQNPLEVGEEFLLRLQIPDISEVLQIRCEVAWARKQAGATKGEPAGMGVKFCEMSDKHAQILKQYLKKEMKKS